MSMSVIGLSPTQWAVLTNVKDQIIEDRPLDTWQVALLVDHYTATLQLLREHIVGWGRCGHPADCNCSDARARRRLGFVRPEPTLSPDGPGGGLFR